VTDDGAAILQSCSKHLNEDEKHGKVKERPKIRFKEPEQSRTESRSRQQGQSKESKQHCNKAEEEVSIVSFSSKPL